MLSVKQPYHVSHGYLATIAISAGHYLHKQTLTAIGPACGRASGLDSRETPRTDRFGTSELHSSPSRSIPFILFVLCVWIPTPSIKVCPTHYSEFTSKSVL